MKRGDHGEGTRVARHGLPGLLYWSLGLSSASESKSESKGEGAGEGEGLYKEGTGVARRIFAPVFSEVSDTLLFSHAYIYAFK